MKNTLNSGWARLAAIGLAGAVAVAGSALAIAHSSKAKQHEAQLNVPMDESQVSRDGLPRGSYAAVVAKVAPAVVKIETTTTIRNSSTQEFPELNDPFWRRFFGDQFGFGPNNRMRQGPMVQKGIGSGVIVSRDGYVLTNNHVVDGAKEVKVTLQDGREFTAKVIGRDPKTDIAVVKIDADDLPVVSMADSSNVKVGDVALAIGNPFGVGQTVTHGIISATRRHVGIEDYEDFLQTDAPINPGNSGGALVDIEGRLIGINTAIFSRSGGSQGVGFAIPSDLAHHIMASLVKTGRVTRGYLGVSIQNATAGLAEEFGLKPDAGVIVAGVIPGGPADKAGVKAGDVVVEYDGKHVTDSSSLQLAVADTAPGTRVPMKILRNGENQSLEATVRQLPGSGPESNSQLSSNHGQDTGTLNGVGVSNLDPDTRRQFDIPDNVEGALVTQVDPDSPSAQAGLKPGVVIQDINRHKVTNAQEAIRLTENSGNKKTLVRIWANGASHYVLVDENKAAG